MAAPGWGAKEEQELEQAKEARTLERQEQERLYRFRRFVEAGFTFEHASQLEQAGADYHLAEQLHDAGCAPDLALRILL